MTTDLQCCHSLPGSVHFYQDSQSRGKSKCNPLRHKYQLDLVKSKLFCVFRCGFRVYPLLENLVPEACVLSAMPKPHNASTQPLTILRRLTDASHILHNQISPTLATVIRHCLHSGFSFFFFRKRRVQTYKTTLGLFTFSRFMHFYSAYRRMTSLSVFKSQFAPNSVSPCAFDP